MGWSLEEIIAATGGSILRRGKSRRFGEVVTDSTQVKPGAVFVALKGTRHDAHRFIPDALGRGARCVIVARKLTALRSTPATAVLVKDTLRALGDLARYRRERLGAKVLAITGSNGKTTTKEMLAAIMEEAILDRRPLRGRVLKTEGNFNNLVGLPLTLLRLRRRHQAAVVELGTNRPGEIERLAQIADPDAAVITSVAAAHLEGLSSLAGVAKEKGALYRNVRPGGVIAVNLDDPRVKKLAAGFAGKKITYGTGGMVRARSWELRGSRGVLVDLGIGRKRCRVRLNYLGRHNVSNALGAAALAFGAGVELAAIRRGLEKARPFAMRMQIERWRSAGIINDAYNANPASMRAALQTLAEIGARGRRIAVLGDMFELGAHSARAHRSVGRAAAAAVDRLYLLGQQAVHARAGALQAGMRPSAIIIADDHAAIAAELRASLKAGDWVLIKGSRGMAMERVVAALRRERA